jgi:hypothetical protein
MNTPHHPAVHYREAPPAREGQHLPASQSAQRGLRPTLHLKPKKPAAIQSAGNDAAVESATGRPSRLPEIGRSM